MENAGFSRGNNFYNNKNSSSSGNNTYSNTNSSDNIHDSNNPTPRGRAVKPQPEEVRRSSADSDGSTDSASEADPPRKTRDGRGSRGDDDYWRRRRSVIRAMSCHENPKSSPSATTALREYMKSLNLEEYVSVLVEQEVDLPLLSCLEEDELEKVGIETVEARARILSTQKLDRWELAANVQQQQQQQ